MLGDKGARRALPGLDDRDPLRGHRAEQAQSLQQFFEWLMEDKQDIDRSPMERVKQPKPQKLLIPVIRDNDTKKMLDTRKGEGFNQLCDEAIIRLYYNTGTHLSEIGNLQLDDIDLEADSVHYHCKGNKDRRVRSDRRPRERSAATSVLDRSTREPSCRTCGSPTASFSPSSTATAARSWTSDVPTGSAAIRSSAKDPLLVRQFGI